LYITAVKKKSCCQIWITSPGGVLLFVAERRNKYNTILKMEPPGRVVFLSVSVILESRHVSIFSPEDSLSRICAHEIYQRQQQQRVPSVFMRLNDLSTFCFLIKSLPFFPGKPKLLIRSRINQLTGPLISYPSEFIQIVNQAC
jgi:hypothetical protein